MGLSSAAVCCSAAWRDLVYSRSTRKEQMRIEQMRAVEAYGKVKAEQLVGGVENSKYLTLDPVCETRDRLNISLPIKPRLRTCPFLPRGGP